MPPSSMWEKSWDSSGAGKVEKGKGEWRERRIHPLQVFGGKSKCTWAISWMTTGRMSSPERGSGRSAPIPSLIQQRQQLSPRRGVTQPHILECGEKEKEAMMRPSLEILIDGIKLFHSHLLLCLSWWAPFRGRDAAFILKAIIDLGLVGLKSSVYGACPNRRGVC